MVSTRRPRPPASPVGLGSKATQERGQQCHELAPPGKNQDGADMVYFEFGSPQAWALTCIFFLARPLAFTWRATARELRPSMSLPPLVAQVCSAGGVSDLDFFQQAGQAARPQGPLPCWLQVTVMGLRGRDDYHKCYLQPGEGRCMWPARRGTCNVHLRGTGLDAQDAGRLSGATPPMQVEPAPPRP